MYICIRRPLPSLGLGGAAPGITVDVRHWVWAPAVPALPPVPACSRWPLASLQFQPLVPRVVTLLQLQPQNPTPPFYRAVRHVSPYPGTLRYALKPSAAASALCAKGCETVPASAPKPPFCRVSKLPFGTFRPALKPPAAP